MNNAVFLHIVERLEGFLGKLPSSMQKPILHELTPLKELFLQQRAPRFVLLGSHPMPLLEFVARIFVAHGAPSPETLTGLFRWQTVTISHHGAIEMLDARGADEAALALVREELRAQPADIFFFLAAERDAKIATRKELERLEKLLAWSDEIGAPAKLIALHTDETKSENAALTSSLADSPAIRARLIGDYSLGAELCRILARELPNEARIEMIRIGGDRGARTEVAEMLVKSTSAICTAVGAQPIPLADMPILTTLQLVMVSGIMYLSGRERSMRAAAEFTGALGANVGIGMVLREGARSALKFFPGWGNVICGMVAGAGTYGIGRAAIVYFIEGASLGDARRTFLQSKKRLSLPMKKKKVVRANRTKAIEE
jgi:uncharacterized protein (DUF697 family)